MQVTPGVWLVILPDSAPDGDLQTMAAIALLLATVMTTPDTPSPAMRRRAAPFGVSCGLAAGADGTSAVPSCCSWFTMIRFLNYSGALRLDEDT